MEFSGVNALIKGLHKRATLDDIRKTVKLNGTELHTKAQRKAAVDTGFMRRSIGISTGLLGLSVVVKPSAEYAPYVEYGTRFISPQPFLRPAHHEQSDKFIKDLRRLMR